MPMINGGNIIYRKIYTTSRSPILPKGLAIRTYISTTIDQQIVVKHQTLKAFLLCQFKFIKFKSDRVQNGTKKEITQVITNTTI